MSAEAPRINPLVERAVQVLDQRVSEFRIALKDGTRGVPNEARSSFLGIVISAEEPKPYSEAYINGDIKLPAHIVGELFISLVDKFSTTIRDITLFDENGMASQYLRIFEAKDEKIAFIRRQEFFGRTGSRITFEIAQSTGLV